MYRDMPSVLSLLLVGALSFPILTAAADVNSDSDASESWQLVRRSLFGDRTIHNDANRRDGTGEVINLRAPGRAQDAAVVPVAISMSIGQTPQRFIRTVYLVIDRNPSPVAGIFNFTTDSGKADIETRVRVEDYTWMRAIAEMNDGSLFMSARYVKAAGGCSAPNGSSPDFDAFTPRLKLKLDASTTAGKPSLAQLMIQHPNSSGLARDQLTQLYIPAYYVRTIEVTYAGKPVMSAQIDFSISENPNFRFWFVPHESAELKAVVVDTKERQTDGALKVELQ